MGRYLFVREFFSLLSCPQSKCPVHHIYTVFDHQKHHTRVRQCLFRPFGAFVYTPGPGSPHGIAKRPFPPPQKGLKNSPNLQMKSILWWERAGQNYKITHNTLKKIICTVLSSSHPFLWCQNSDQSYPCRARWALLVHFHENWSRSSEARMIQNCRGWHV